MGVAGARHNQNQQQQYPNQQQYPSQQYPAQQYPVGGGQQYPGGYPVGGQQYPTGGQPAVNNYYQQGQPQRSGGIGGLGTAAIAGIGGLALYGALKPSEQKTIIIHEGGNNGTSDAPIPSAPPAAGTPPIAPQMNPDGTPVAPMPPMAPMPPINANGMPMAAPPLNPDGTPMTMKQPQFNPDGTPILMPPNGVPMGVNGVQQQMAPNGQYMYPPQQNGGNIDPQNQNIPLAPFPGQQAQEQHVPLAPFPGGPPAPPPSPENQQVPVLGNTNTDPVVPLAPLPPALPVCEAGQNPTDNNCTIALPLVNDTAIVSSVPSNAPEIIPTTAATQQPPTQQQPIKDLPVVPVAHTDLKASNTGTTMFTNIFLVSFALAFLVKF